MSVSTGTKNHAKLKVQKVHPKNLLLKETEKFDEIISAGQSMDY